MIGRPFAAVAFAAAIMLPAPPARAVTFTVTTAADTADESNDGLCLDTSGECSLRAAITEANRTTEKDVVVFAIPGGAVATIDLVTALPSITKPIEIFDPGPGYHVQIKTTHGVATGFDLAPGSDGSNLANLPIGGFQTGVHVRSNGSSLGGLRLGSDASGTVSIPNTVVGLRDEGDTTTIAGTNACASPIGIVLAGANTIMLGANVIGSCDGGTSTLPNGTGVLVSASGIRSFFNGGAHLIIGNLGDGVRVTGASSGSDYNGWYAFQNGGDGLRFEDTASDNMVNQSQFYDNGGAGIAVRSGARNNRFSDSIFHNNGGLAIDLLESGNTTGITANDVGDVDTGANDQQNFPSGKAGTGSTTLRILSGGTIIQGGLSSVANRTFTVEYYQSPSCDPSGFGEGQEKITTSNTTGCTSVTSDATGYSDIGCQLAAAIHDGWFVTAIATGEGGTSEFSQCASLNPTTTTTTTPTTTSVPTTSSTSSSTIPPTTSSSSTSSSTTHSTTSTAAPTTSLGTPSTSTTTKTSTTLVSTTTSVPPTTTTTSTAASSTSLAGSTTSTTSLPGGSTSSSTTGIATTTLPSTTTSSPVSTTSSTSSTLVPSCGDGVVTPPERCDPAVPGSELCCNPATCLPVGAGGNCGLERDECGAPVCDGAGTCITKPALQRFPCRAPGSIGPCDPGALCGIEPYCPTGDTASGCEALDFALTANSAKLKFRCTAKASEQGSVKCGADLVGRPGSPLVARRRRGAKLVAVPASDCTGAQFDTTLPKKLAKVDKDDLARLIVARINKADRTYFEPGKTICVRVRFTTTNGFSQTRLYDVTVPPAP
jgi:CSLREA domain-containing protein